MTKPIDNLRATVRKRRSAVTAKENRIKRNTGVDVRGTNLDPRLPVNAVNKMGTPQLKKYLQSLEAFMSRDNGFVAGAGNTPIPRNEWNNYKRIEKQYNSIGALIMNKIQDIKIDPMNITIGAREKRMIPDKPMDQGEVVHRPYGFIDRKSTKIRDVDALRKLTAALEKKINMDYLPAQIATARSQAEKLLTTVGNGEFAKYVRSPEANKDIKRKKKKGEADAEEVPTLTDSQFNILWNYTHFATAVSALSDSGKSGNTTPGDGSKDSDGRVESGYGSDIRKFLEWARTLPETGTERIEKSATKTRTPRKAKKPRRR